MDKLNIEKLRANFPILGKKIHGIPLIYLDNAATTQKPSQVLDAINYYYTQENANVHRGLHKLAELADASFQEAREKVRAFINAEKTSEIIFVKGTTEAINLVAQSFGRSFLKSGDTILLSMMEHHSNIVPWQILGDMLGTKISAITVNSAGELDLDDYTRLLKTRPKLVAITHVSNVLGTVNPVKEIIAKAHALEIPVLLDGAQAIAHLPVDVKDLDCDFYAFSGHKMYAPTGIGVLYAKEQFLKKMLPYQGGGGMIEKVNFAKTSYAELPDKFEAGTPNIEGAFALGAAIDYLKSIGMDKISQHEQDLLHYANTKLSEVPGLSILGNPKNKSGVISILLDNIHAHDIGTILDRDGIAVRAGHHCAMPLLSHLKVPATIRASFGLYNTKAEIDSLVTGLTKVKRFFSNG